MFHEHPTPPQSHSALYFASVMSRTVAKDLIDTAAEVPGMSLEAFDFTDEQMRLARIHLGMVDEANRPNLLLGPDAVTRRLNDEVLLVTRADSPAINSRYQQLARPILAAEVSRLGAEVSPAVYTPKDKTSRPKRAGRRGPYRSQTTE